jgi:DNA-binding NarL/FixJ family response regulator
MTDPQDDRDLVLVVDDSPETLGMLNHALDQAGLTVLVALEGLQAVAIARKMQPDIILLDAVMPNLDGFATCRILKSDPELADVPVIFMTGLSATEDIVKGLEAGGVDYVTKPVKPQELIARMRVHLNNARMTQSARTALDTAGQFLFTTAPSGELLWATPQVHHLFERSGADRVWLDQHLMPQLRHWFGHLPGDDSAAGCSLTLTGLSRPLQVRYLGQAAAGERLLRLTNPERPSEAESLRRNLAVTEREADVLVWIAHGKTNREIGQILNMSPRTVNKHLEQIFRKLGVENRTTAAAMALRHLGDASQR